MHAKVKNIEHNGKNIVYVNGSGNPSESEMNEIISSVLEVYKATADDAILLLLWDSTDTPTSKSQKEKFEVLSKEAKRFRLFTSIIGVTGVGRLIANMLMSRKSMNFSKNMDEAKEWLVKQ